MRKSTISFTLVIAFALLSLQVQAAKNTKSTTGNTVCNLCSPQISRPRIRAVIGGRTARRRPLSTVRARYTCANSRVRYLNRGGRRYRVIYRCCGYAYRRNGRTVVRNPRCRPLVQRA